MLTKRNKVERMTIVNTLLTSIYEELLKDEVDDIDGLLQIVVYAQVEMNRIVFDLNQRNGCEPIADTPQTESTGSPIGDYRDGVGVWKTDCEDRYAIRTDSGEVVAYACPLGCEQTDCPWE